MYTSGLTIWYGVSDIEVTKNFYENLLGFAVNMYDPENGMVIMKAPTSNTAIGFSKSEKVSASAASVVFDVVDIEESVEKLSTKGVEFVGDIETIPGLVKLATFSDPDGNSLMIAQDLSND